MLSFYALDLRRKMLIKKVEGGWPFSTLEGEMLIRIVDV